MSTRQLLEEDPLAVSDDLTEVEETSLNDFVNEAKRLVTQGKEQEAPYLRTS
ncbi:MAG: hypothetical protein ACK5QS_10520 [Pseudanabaenaceae cyanobacterium]|jgi:hypothetical protein